MGCVPQKPVLPVICSAVVAVVVIVAKRSVAMWFVWVQALCPACRRIRDSL